ncbi:SEC-C metal-binding domain-containing protein [Imperialibacter roseus]|uniref:SEC-C metal-binding domain-containing protein n=1 Tax=Imperialibacter roseus TaxID=1324217 RepID=A0ABZ0IVY5_9BACT|nr:SEC-C metal-binding domain-containing protein [Imperialibacter roseus]WOK08543.1 SEC-C metal-binding domain-containing protein [Imperialibacter roseus]
MDHYHSDEEMHFLGFHLLQKLWKNPEYDHVLIDREYGQLIDRNYYPHKLGIETSSQTDKVRNKWKNEFFDDLIYQIDDFNFPKKTDVIFHLLDWSEVSRDNLTNQLRLTKEKTQLDGKTHNFTLMSGPERSTHGLTFISWHNNNLEELQERLYLHSRGRKYKSRANVWIGIGCLKDSGRTIDAIAFNNEKWQYDEELEGYVKTLFDGINEGKTIKFNKKIGRNEYCPCGSGIKYKKCCGRAA